MNYDRLTRLRIVLLPGHVGSGFEDIPDPTQVKKVKTLNPTRVWFDPDIPGLNPNS